MSNKNIRTSDVWPCCETPCLAGIEGVLVAWSDSLVTPQHGRKRLLSQEPTHMLGQQLVLEEVDEIMVC
jgi:hypothetical protein